MTAVRLSYGPGFVMIRAYLSLFSFMAALWATSEVWPLFFQSSKAMDLWAGLLMIPGFWMLIHWGVVAALRLLFWPFRIPGRFSLTDEGVVLATREGIQSLEWEEVVRVEVNHEALDLSVVHDQSADAQVGRAVAQGLALFAAKAWTLSFVGRNTRLTVEAEGFARPVRRAAPRIRAFLAQRGYDVAKL